MSSLTPRRAVFLVARREFLTKVRAKSFVIGTLAIIAVMAGYALFQTVLIDRSERDTVALAGQATLLAEPLKRTAESFGREIEVVDATDAAAAEQRVRAGEVDVLVTGAPDALRVVVKERLNDALRNSIDLIVKQQVLNAQLAEAGLDPVSVARTVDAAKVDVVALEPGDSQRGQRMVIGLVIAALLYYSLLVYGTMVAQGVVEEKSSRVVEILLSTLRPWQLLLGKVVGLGLVGLLQLLIIGGIGVAVSSATGLVDVTGLASGALAVGVLWYLLGFFLYATVYAAAASLVPRQEELQSVMAPISMVIVVVFVVGINLMIQDGSSTLVAILSMLPPFAPILMPGRMAMGVAPLWQVAVAVVLAIGAVAAITWLGGKVYSNAVLHTGSRVKLRDVLR
ncbi:ABC transporter permease [Actinosynnema sp. NPDC047251]|uniref:ABC-type transporter, permease subunit n=1 Tax=Saccharothrix espanaensis (strain ATCC 51144 / DSM 44229 / JCM 9112 / NBRC 15066 / NRRL 15764) TaxID=1179773 RepID=K0JRD4_SACES|nr:ABC transporter permease [Saccharothrix espanaensis]CCH27902.1 ABC-type transporter, permease subunit [Saccharothrix espanaensis DSM 44229]